MSRGLHPKRQLIDHVLISIFPTLGIQKADWLAVWEQQEFKVFTIGARAFFLTWVVVYGIHYWAIDIPARKEHLELWAIQRAVTAGANFIGLLITYSRWYNETRFYRLPLLIITAITIHMQALAMSWREDVPFFYVPLQAMLGIVLMRYSPIVSLALLPVVLLAAKLSFFVRPGQNHHMVSASIVAGMFLILFRSRMTVDLRAFMAEHENIETQKQLIEAQQALVDQLKSFLPREIYRRVQNAMKERGLSALDASESVLRPRRTFASVLFTDIRGFTKMTNSIVSGATRNVTEAQQHGTEIVERFRGIPRLHGDLIYSYFDLESPAISLASSLRAAFELIEETDRLNSTLSSENRILRYVIVTFGEVIVGNIGSSEGARDITVLGACANLPSRIDPLTKEPSLKEPLSVAQIILSKDAYEIAKQSFPSLKFTELDLSVLNLRIRDFPEQKFLYLLRTSSDNWDTLANTPNEDSTRVFVQQKYEPNRDAA